MRPEMRVCALEEKMALPLLSSSPGMSEKSSWVSWLAPPTAKGFWVLDSCCGVRVRPLFPDGPPARLTMYERRRKSSSRPIMRHMV